MTIDPDQCMKIRASGKYDEGWWIFSSKSPLISGGLHGTMQEAQDAYYTMLVDYMGKVWSIEPERIILYEKKVKANHVSYFTDNDGILHKTVSDNDVRVSIIFCIQERELNRKLDEFDDLVVKRERELRNMLAEHGITMDIIPLGRGTAGVSAKVKEVYDRIMDISAQTGMNPQEVLEKAHAELAAQKAGEAA